MVLVVFGACFGGGTNTTESGLGRPEVTIDVPEQVEAGSTTEVVVSVSNPGPGDIGSLAVAFALVGPVQADGTLPTPLIGIGPDNSVVSTDPASSAISDNGSVYVFGSEGGGAPILPEGEDIDITFTVEVPSAPGVAANSVQVYDGSQVDRADGARLETTISR